MTNTLCDERKAARSGDFTLSLSNRSIKRQSTERTEYVVITPRLEVSLETVVNDPGIPAFGSMRNGRVCKKKSVESVAAIPSPAGGHMTYKWIVSVDWDSDFISDPLLLPPEVSSSTEIIEETLWFDLDKKPIVNANGETIPATRPVVVTTRTIRKYENADFSSEAWNDLWANAVNENTFWGRPKDCVLMLPCTDQYVTININDDEKKLFVLATYSFRSRSPFPYEDPWTFRPLHVGNMARKSPGEKPGRATDDYGHTTQVNLDKDGVKLADNAEPVFLKFKIYPRRDFSSLGIDKDQLNWFGEVRI